MGGRGGFSHGYHVYIPRSPLSLRQKQKENPYDQTLSLRTKQKGSPFSHAKTNKKTKRDKEEISISNERFDSNIESNGGGQDENETEKEKG